MPFFSVPRRDDSISGTFSFNGYFGRELGRDGRDIVAGTTRRAPRKSRRTVTTQNATPPPAERPPQRPRADAGQPSGSSSRAGDPRQRWGPARSPTRRSGTSTPTRPRATRARPSVSSLASVPQHAATPWEPRRTVRRGRVLSPPRLPRGHSVETRACDDVDVRRRSEETPRGREMPPRPKVYLSAPRRRVAAAAAAWIFRGDARLDEATSSKGGPRATSARERCRGEEEVPTCPPRRRVAAAAAAWIFRGDARLDDVATPRLLFVGDECAAERSRRGHEAPTLPLQHHQMNIPQRSTTVEKRSRPSPDEPRWRRRRDCHAKSPWTNRGTAAATT